eukprot:CAMPEP_0179211432 /NCGR_PEP_ID=MMETSP0797-20121207/458_1 /TAXON_ID=47934 /ORGANISM="Dinophysis acuminata, Strain DAEP01" /LENGTH=66 /DNA_ID=CAMNT_0020916755 /DNA_START=229 /DNA_END=425 /DNA_ORIENTATION=-
MLPHSNGLRTNSPPAVHANKQAWGGSDAPENRPTATSHGEPQLYTVRRCAPQGRHQAAAARHIWTV